MNLFQKFKRNPVQGRYIPALDGLRFLAIIAVILFHAHCHFFPEPAISDVTAVSPARWAEYAIGKGYYGVYLFFIISGFIIALPFYRSHREGGSRPKVKEYLWRRFKRIEMPYFIALTAGLFWVVFAWGETWSDTLPHFLKGITYSNNLLSEELNPLLPVSWTLELEIQFYLLAPVLALVFKLPSYALRSTVLAIAILGLPSLLDLLNDILPSVFWSKRFLIHHLPYFFTGMWCLDTYRSLTVPKCLHLPLDGIAIVSGIGCLLLLSFGQTDRYEPLLLGLFVIASMSGHWVKRLLSTPLFTLFGGMCYSLYLFHGWILHLVLHTTPLKTQVAPWNYTNILLVTGLILLITIPFYLLIEKPFMQHKKFGEKPPR